MLKRLQWRFIRIAMGSTLLVFVFLLAAINVLSYGRLLQGADAMLRFISDNDGRLPEYAQVLSGDLRPEPAVHYTEETPFFTRFFVVHGDGTTVTDVEMERIAAVSETEASDFYVQALQQEKEYGFCGDYRYRAVENGEDTTVVFLNFEPDRRTALNTLLISATVAAVAYLAVFLLVYLLSKRAIRPMLRSAEQQKQFLTDAGHELKTPLTIISTSADVLDAELPNNEWVASIRRQAGRMSGLIANLITLSRMEEETPFQNDSFVLSEAVWDVAEQYRAVAETLQRRLMLEIADGVEIRGDAAAIQQMLSLLLDNAVRYADEGTTIALRLYVLREIILEVENGCTLPDDLDPERLFDRFYRVDTTRSRTTGGSGIGLSVARAIVEHHGGTLTAARHGRSICFRARFPQ